MADNNKKEITVEGLDEADSNGDGHISKKELSLHLEFKRKELEDADAQRDAMRKMTWFALFGMLFYPGAILITAMLGYDKAANIIGDIAPTYFVAIAGLVAAFFGANAYSSSKSNSKKTD
jgi:FtsH-binding integral membrane protein